MTELEQKLLAENEQLRHEVDELKRKLETETAPRVEYVDEKTRRFRGVLYRKHESTGYYMKSSLCTLTFTNFITDSTIFRKIVSFITTAKTKTETTTKRKMTLSI